MRSGSSAEWNSAQQRQRRLAHSPVSDKLTPPVLRADSWQLSKGVKQLWPPVLKLLRKTAQGQLGSLVVKS